MTELSVEPQPRSIFSRLAVFLLVIIVLLGLANLAILGIKTLDRPGRPTPGQLLYATTFDAYNEEWSQFEGQMSSQVMGGSLVISINASHDGAYSVLNHEFSNFDLRVDAKRLMANDEYNEIGVLFRYLDPDNYYIFKIRGDGFYRVERRKGGQTDVLSEWHGSPSILAGINTVNQIHIIGRDSAFQFFVNDQPLILCPSGPGKLKSTWDGDQCLSNSRETSATLQDTTFDYGKIGVGVRVDKPGTQVAFDNVLIYGA